MALPDHTTAAVLHGIDDVRTEERPMPVPGAGEVLVEIRSVGICGSDVHYFREGRIGDFVVDAPLVLGHEASGVVVGLGDGVVGHRLGQRVALEPGVPDGTCPSCRAGRYNLCADVRFFATPPVDGTLIGHVVHPEGFAHAVPDALTDDAAALLEPLSVAIWACRKAAIQPGDRVLVTGGGPIGLLCAAVARASGAAAVTVSDPIEARRNAARVHGATETVDPASDELPDADVLLECSGIAAAIVSGIRALGPAGRAVSVGMAASATTDLPLAHIQSREISLTGTFRYASTYGAAISMASSGAVDLDALVGRRYPLARTVDALRVSSLDPTIIKPVVLPRT